MVDTAQPVPVVPTGTPAAPSPITAPSTAANPQEIEGLGGSGGANTTQTPPPASGPPPITLDAIAGTSELPSLEPKSLTTPLPTPVSHPEPLTGPAPSSIPDVNQMQQTLNQSGTLLPELRVQPTKPEEIDHSPLAALQPKYLQQNPQAAEGISGITPPATAPAPPSVPKVPLASTKHSAQTVGALYIPDIPVGTIVGIALLIQAAIGILQLMHFAMAQYPSIEQSLLMNELAQSEVTTYWFKSSVLGLFMLASLVVGGVLLLSPPSQRKLMIAGGGGLLIFANLFIQNVFVQPQLISGNPFELINLIQQIQAQPLPETSSLYIPTDKIQ